MKAVTAEPSVSGVMKGTYFRGGRTIKWEGLQLGKKHFLYLAQKRETKFNPKAFRIYSRLTRSGIKSDMLMAVFDGTTGEIEKHPEGKIYAETMTASSSMLSPVIVDFKTGGLKGFVANVQRKISFIQVSRLYDGDMSGEQGEVAIGYYGKDEVVESSTQAIIYNKGDVGISMRALIFCG
jgi:hypothetical protein